MISTQNKTYQVSIFLQNKIGHFERITRILKQQGISIRTMTLTNTVSGWGILNLVVDRPQFTVEKLNEHNISAALREIMILRMSDQPGGLDEILTKLAKAEINFNNAYGRVVDEDKNAYLVLEIEKSEETYSKLIDVELIPLTPEQTYADQNVNQ